MPDHPCADGLTPACFKAYPGYARKVLAYKLMLMMLPEEVSADLPGWVHEAGKSLPPDWPASAEPPAFIKAAPKVPAAVRARGPVAPRVLKPFSPGPVHRPAAGPSTQEWTTEFNCTGSEYWARAASPWAAQHDAVSGTSGGVMSLSPGRFGRTSFNGAFYIIERSIWRFDLSGLPVAAEMISGFFTFHPSSGTLPNVCMQETSSIAWNAAADYSKGTGAAIDPKQWTGSSVVFTLTASALAACKAAAAGLIYFMGKEYTHDFLDAAPTAGQNFEAQGYNNNDATPGNRPVLTLVYRA